MTTTKIDRLGLLQAELAPLLAKEEKLKAEIVAELGDGAHEGRWYRVTIANYVRETLPIKVARAKLTALGVGTRWFRSHTDFTPVTTVTCKARTGHNLKAAA